MCLSFIASYYVMVFALAIVAQCAAAKSHTTTATATATTTTTMTDVLPRLFPAAKQEQYDPQTRLLRTLRFDRMQFLHTTSAPKAQAQVQHDPVLVEAKKRFFDYLKTDLPDYPEDYPVNPQNQTLVPIKGIHLVVVGNTTTRHNHLPHNFDESYQIKMGASSSDNIMVQAKTVFGVVRGLESLAQLLEFGWEETPPNTKKPDQYPVHIMRNTPLFIADAPTYPFRGLMIDTSRHYLPLKLILQNINVMGMNKLNVLHWHITDAQSWPFQSTTYPELSATGAYSKHAVYSHADVQQVIQEGYLRGIRVIPEFDLPGHSQVIDKSHPELMSKCARAAGTFSQPLDPTLPEVYDFVEALYKEVAALFPDEFMHIGGDEVDLSCWDQDPVIQSWAKAHDMSSNDLLNYFESVLTDIVASNGKTPIAWQELLNEGVDLPPGTVIDVWKHFDAKTIEDATKRNYRVVISGCWYLDHLGDNWKTYYDCEPLAFNGTAAQKKLIMGGHASIWGERVDATDFMAKVWPRASAVAERLWSGSVPKSYHEVLSNTVTQRIADFRCFMVLRGVSAAPIWTGSCPHEQPFPPTRTRESENMHAVGE